MNPQSLSRLVEEMADAAVRGGADQAESMARFSDTTRIELKQGEIEGVRRTAEVAAALRVLVDGRPGFAYATDPDPDGIRTMVRDAVDSSRLVQGGVENRFSDQSEMPVVTGILDMEGITGPFEGKVDVARRLESAALEVTGVKKVHKPSFAQQHRATAICSGGQVWTFEDSHFSIGGQAVAGDGEESMTGFDYRTFRRMDDLVPETVGRNAGQSAVGMLGGNQPDSGEYPAVLPPRVAIDLLHLLVSSFSAEEMQKGRSRLAGRMGERVFSEKLTLHDDGLLPGGAGTVPFDDERVPPVPRVLIDRGTVSGGLHNLKTASLDGVPPTGNGFRGSLASAPVPSPANLFFEPGTGPLEDLLPTGTVLWIDMMMGVHTADTVSGAFSVGAAGYIMNGKERVRPFRNGTVSGNLFDLFSSIEALGDDLTFYGSTGSPSLLVDRIIVSGK